MNVTECKQGQMECIGGAHPAKQHRHSDSGFSSWSGGFGNIRLQLSQR